jgi:hypothetical protein
MKLVAELWAAVAEVLVLSPVFVGLQPRESALQTQLRLGSYQDRDWRVQSARHCEQPPVRALPLSEEPSTNALAGE